MTHEKTILQHFQNNPSLTPMQAWTEYGIYRLSCYIQRLRNKGYQITTERTMFKARNGAVAWFGTYKMKDNEK